MLPCHVIYRKRFNIGRLRQSTTDRPSLTADTWKAVNVWRRQLGEIQSSPGAWGIGMPADWDGGIPDDLIIGVDETPLHYIPTANGTYVTGTASAVYIAGVCRQCSRV